MPRKKKDYQLPEDLDAMTSADAQQDLRDAEDLKQHQIEMERLEALNQAFRLVASTPEGVEVLRHVLWLTGFASPLITYSRESLELNGMASIYNVSKRDVWMEIRKRLPAQLLREIEIPLEVQKDE